MAFRSAIYSDGLKSIAIIPAEAMPLSQHRTVGPTHFVTTDFNPSM